MIKPIKLKFWDLYDETKYDIDGQYFLIFVLLVIVLIALPFMLIKLILKFMIKEILK